MSTLWLYLPTLKKPRIHEAAASLRGGISRSDVSPEIPRSALPVILIHGRFNVSLRWHACDPSQYYHIRRQ